jgi:hypothetical protein
LDEGGQIMSEGRRFAWVDLNRGRSRQPRLNRPWERIASTGLADRNRLGCREGSAIEELTRGVGLTVPGEANSSTDRVAHSGNWLSTSARTASTSTLS